MTTPNPITPANLKPPPAQGCVIDPTDGPWEVLIAAREAGALSDESWSERARAYDAHDRIVSAFHGVPDYQPGTVTPGALDRWIEAVSRDAFDAQVLRLTLNVLLAYAVYRGLREGDPSPLIPTLLSDPLVIPEPAADKASSVDQSLPSPPIEASVTAHDVLMLLARTFGPGNGWSVLCQGLVGSAWYQDLSPTTQAAFVARCRTIATAFHGQPTLTPHEIRPERIVAWVEDQTTNDNVAASYYVAFSRMLRAFDQHDCRPAALLTQFGDLLPNPTGPADDANRQA